MIKLPHGFVCALVCFWVGVVALVAHVEAPAAQEKSFLWQVRSDKGTTYLLGSIHLLKRENYPLQKIIDDSFDAAKRLVFEVDINNARPEKIHQLMLQKGMNSDGTTLQQNISKETYTLLEDRTTELGLNIGAITLLKPWFAALTIQALKLQKLGFDSSFGVDHYLARRAQQAGKPSGGLETTEFQIGLFDQLSLREQELMLRQTLKQLDLLEPNVDRIVQSWSTGDVSSLERLLLASMREYPEVYQKLMVDRNRRWLPKIEQIIQQGERTMIVVGAAHLVGKDGLISLLRARGYKVEPL
ncbi:MAG TPA: TraB/GumN family protein [Candidatus Binatia bacterium]|nr:TraB/GumN family protein [Candidatus Binatia bacterium]